MQLCRRYCNDEAGSDGVEFLCGDLFKKHRQVNPKCKDRAEKTEH